MNQMFPITEAWRRVLDEFPQQTCSALSGNLEKLSLSIEKPFWCRQMKNMLPSKLVQNLQLVKSSMEPVGGHPSSSKIIPKCHNAMNWSPFPCTCQYKYFGWSGTTLQYGNPYGLLSKVILIKNNMTHYFSSNS